MSKNSFTRSFSEFADIKDDVEQGYQVPIAVVFRRYRLSDAKGPWWKTQTPPGPVRGFYQVSVHHPATRGSPDFHRPQKSSSRRGEDVRFFKKKPFLGGWVGLLRILTKLPDQKISTGWINTIANWYRTPMTKLLHDLGGINFDRRTKTLNAKICNALVTYRNKQFTYAASLTADELERRLPLLETVLAHLLISCEFLAVMNVCYTERVKCR